MSLLAPIAGIQPMPIAQLLAPTRIREPEMKVELRGRITVEGSVRIADCYRGSKLLEKLVLAGAPIEVIRPHTLIPLVPRFGHDYTLFPGWELIKYKHVGAFDVLYAWRPELPEFPEADR